MYITIVKHPRPQQPRKQTVHIADHFKLCLQANIDGPILATGQPNTSPEKIKRAAEDLFGCELFWRTAAGRTDLCFSAEIQVDLRTRRL